MFSKTQFSSDYYDHSFKGFADTISDDGDDKNDSEKYSEDLSEPTIISAIDISASFMPIFFFLTAIILWANAGLTNREIMTISGHLNESSLQSYHNMPSAYQVVYTEGLEGRFSKV